MPDRRLELELAGRNATDAMFEAAQKRIHELTAEVDQANQKMRSEAPQLYAIRMGQIRAEATKLAQGTRSLVGRDLQGLDQVLAKTGGTTTKTTGSLRELKSGLTSLAFQFTGTAGAAGKLAEGILAFGGGTPLVLGVAAGLALIGAAVSAYTKEQREAKKATDDAIASLLRLRSESRGKDVQIEEQRAQARDRVREVTQRLADVERDLAYTRAQLSSPSSAAQSDAAAMRLGRLESEKLKLLDQQREALMAQNAPELARQRERYAEHSKLLLSTFIKLNQEYAEAVIKATQLRNRTDDQGAAIQRLRFQAQGLAGADLDAAMATWKQTQAINRQIEALEKRNALIRQAEADVEAGRVFRRLMQQGLDAGSAAEIALELKRVADMARREDEKRNANPKLRGVEQERDPVTGQMRLKAPAPVAAGESPFPTEAATTFETIIGGINTGLEKTLLQLTDMELLLATDLGAAAEHFGAALGSSFTNAIAGGKNLGKALKQATMSSLADIARSKAKYYAAEALAALAGAFFPKFNPSGLFAFAKYTAAAAAMGAIAGGLSGGGGGGGGGAGAGGGGESTRSDQGSTSTGLRPIVNVYLVGQGVAQLVRSIQYESQRYQQLGGRPQQVSVQVPGLVITG